MSIVRSRNGVPVRLAEERWLHIIRRHPEMAEQRDRDLETLAAPEMIQGDLGELLAIRSYAETPLTSKFLVVAYREAGAADGFIFTSYLSSRPLARRRIIRRQ